MCQYTEALKLKLRELVAEWRERDCDSVGGDDATQGAEDTYDQCAKELEEALEK